MFPHILVTVLLTFPGHTPFVTVNCSGGSIFTSTAGVRPAGQGRASRSRCRGVPSAGGAPREGKGQPPRTAARSTPTRPSHHSRASRVLAASFSSAVSPRPPPFSPFPPHTWSQRASSRGLRHLSYPPQVHPAGRGLPRDFSDRETPLPARPGAPGFPAVRGTASATWFQQGADRHVLVLETVT